jgi:hypothetical protein
MEDNTVQGTWNIFENKLVNIVDSLIPETTFNYNDVHTYRMPVLVKSKINERKGYSRFSTSSNTLKHKKTESKFLTIK